MAIVAVSPHLDDAALSASVRLRRCGATVLTVFAGMPMPGLTVSLWDRVSGATSSADRQLERLAEDAEVMRLLSARASYLDEREVQYRQGDAAPDLDRLADRIAAHVAEADEIWLPAAIGRHPDHVIARDAGLRAAAATGHSEVVLYADFPYVITYGWPAWLSGRPADPYLNSEIWLTEQLSTAGLRVSAREAEVIKLDPVQRAAKATVIAAYRSQASVLGLTADELAREPAKLSYELSWRMPLDGAAGSAGAQGERGHHPAERA